MLDRSVRTVDVVKRAMAVLLAGIVMANAPCCVHPARGNDGVEKAPRLILVHYMPWFEADPTARRWGWHWTMNKYDPNVVNDDRRAIASKYYPTIGPYDSGDPHVLEYHLLLMKIAGIDGVIADWYGIRDLWDYGIIHRNTGLLFEQARLHGLKVAICYEDKTIPNLVKENRIAAGERVSHAAEVIDWLGKQWFSMEHYARVGGKPLLLSFGHDGLDDKEWTKCLADAAEPIAYFSEHHKRTAAVGGYDWPIPKEGLASIERFRRQSKDWPQRIPAAYPRFDDIYAEAGIGANLGHVADRDGATFRSSLEASQKMAAPAVQLVTWNDWGEGTMIEPSREYGTRDLQSVQQHRRRHVEKGFAATAADLELPRRLLELRRTITAAEGKERLDRLAGLLRQGQYDAARAELKTLEVH